MGLNDIFITGYAKLPQGITAKELYSVIAIGVVVDRNTNIILDADVTLATELARSVVKKLLVGKSLSDVEQIEKAFKTHYFGSARKAIISAVKTCSEKFKQICDGNDELLED